MPHDININPGCMSKAALRREGFAYGKYMASQFITLAEQARTGGILAGDVVDGMIVPGLTKDWRGTIAGLSEWLSPKQIQIFQDAARAEFAGGISDARRADMVIAT